MVENLDDIELIQIPNVLTESESLNESLFSLEQCNENNILPVENLPIAVENIDNQLNCNQYSDGLELVNYKVELMDQFEFRNEQENTECQNQNTLSNGIYGVDDQSSGTDIVLSYLYPEDFSIDDLPMEVMETLQMPTSSKESFIQSDDDGSSEHEQLCRNFNDSQLELYINWLNSVIETTNSVLDFNSDGHPEPLIFSVPHVNTDSNRFSFTYQILFMFFILQAYFDIFRTKFSAGTKKKRLPNHTTVITDGKYKNLTMFTWIFSNIKMIKYILSTKAVSFGSSLICEFKMNCDSFCFIDRIGSSAIIPKNISKYI